MFKFLKNNFEDEFFSDIKKSKLNKNILFRNEKNFKLVNFKNELLDYSNLISNKDAFKIYFKIRKVYDSLLFESVNIDFNLFIIYPGLNGREYNKTTSMMITNSNKILFQVIHGQGYIILENLEDIKDIKIIKIKKGSIIIVPKNFLFTIINSSLKTNLILINIKNKFENFKYNILKKNAGTTFYYTQTGFIKNKNYSPLYHLEDYENNYLLNYSFKNNNNIYLEFIKFPEKFNFLLN